MRKKFRFLEHKADMLFEAYGKTLSESIENAGLALFSAMADVGKLTEEERISIRVKASDLGELVVFTLSELLSESDARGLFFKSFKVKKLDRKENEYFVEGEAWGERKKPENALGDVKAVTFHELEVKEGKDGWIIRVLLDV
ncbi:MAG: archease [Candidatus Micrarchaeia archaeon]